MVIETARGNYSSGGRECDMVDLFLVTEEAGYGLRRGGRRPEIDCEIIRGGNEALDNSGGDSGGGGKTGNCFFEFFSVRGRGGMCVIVVSGAKNKIGRECKVIDPMGVSCKGRDESTGRSVPDLYSFVLRRGVDLAGAPPAHAGYGAFVAGENELNASRDYVPDADGGVLGSGSETRAAEGLKVVGFPS